jgi:uncharacterized protein with HEPN domain
MIKRTALPRLQDILSEIDAVESIVADLEFGDYRGSVVARRAVERCVEIVSEASRHIPAELTDDYPEIPWSEIRAVGNLLRHKYEVVNDLVIWRVATRSLPELRPVIVAMIEKVRNQNS